MAMTPTMRAEINRRNAARSTGPSPEARQKTRFNAVKHGCRARLPILPGEDPEAYQRRLQAWIGKFRPADDVELYLVERAVHVSWQLDRADRAEVARLAQKADDEAARQARDVAMLGAELFHVPGVKIESYPADPRGLDPGLVSSPFEPTDRRHPGRLVVALEATAMGCGWLREQWAALGKLLDDGLNWQAPDRLRAIRLLGKQPLDLAEGKQVMSIYVACHAMDPEGPDVFAEAWIDMWDSEFDANRKRLADRCAAAVREERASLRRGGRPGGPAGDRRRRPRPGGVPAGDPRGGGGRGRGGRPGAGIGPAGIRRQRIGRMAAPAPGDDQSHALPDVRRTPQDPQGIRRRHDRGRGAHRAVGLRLDGRRVASDRPV